jgi:Secretion system C-terminal sorting domain
LGDKGLIWVTPSAANETYSVEHKVGINWEIIAKDFIKADSFKVNAGIYRVIVKMPQLVGCMDISPEIVVKDTGIVISGTVLKPTNTPSASSQVRLIKIDSPTSSSQISTTNTDANGNYQFVVKTLGDYKILAYANNLAFPSPTYFGNTSNINVATIIKATECKTYAASIKLIGSSPAQELSDNSYVVKIQNNPFSDQLLIDIMDTKVETLSIELLNLNGSIVQTWTHQTNGNVTTLTLYPHVAQGVYFLKIENKGLVKQVFKVMKI